MASKKGVTGLKILNTFAFVLMIAVNVLAEVLPLNGVTTGEVSDSYPNLFAPAGFTFSIWGLIYLLLAGFVLYQFGVPKGDGQKRDRIIFCIDLYFVASCAANAAWIFAWHYRQIGLSVALMIVLLVCLAVIVSKILHYEPLVLREKLLIKLPFSVYFGWITVAVIANITALLVSLDWNGWGISDEKWTVIILFVGLLLAAEIMLKNGDIAYGLTVLWAYAGILQKHISPNGFGGKYSVIITAVAVALFVLVTESLYLAVSKRRTAAK